MQEALPEFEARDLFLFAGSVDTLEDAASLRDKLDLRFPIGYGLDPLDVSERFGAYYDSERRFLHATGFVLRPDNTVVSAVYSTGSMGRLTSRDALRLVDFYKRKEGA